jgi:ornithine cyclodeaminase/alanine dehydrogenase-like protein (mu-crystallin family)
VESGKLKHENIWAEISDIAIGRIDGRETEGEDIVGVPVGLGTIDIACAYEAYKEAVKRGVGTRFQFVEGG